MVRKYEPTHEVEYDKWNDLEFHRAVMKETTYGEWVPLKVFEDEQRRFNATILKLKNRINKMYDT